MLVFAQTFSAFPSQGDHFSNVPGLLIFACVSFSRYNPFSLTKTLQRLSKFSLSEQILLRLKA